MKLLTHALDDHALRDGDSLALRFLVTGDCDGECVELSYAQFRARALGIAAELQKRLEVGDRVLLLYDGGVDFIVAMYGCLYAGVIAVPTYPPDPGRLHRTLPRLQAIAEDAGATVVLTTGGILSVAEPLCQQVEELTNLSWISTPDLTTPPEQFSSVSLELGHTAYLQYTSGSTGVPKGVIVSHGNLGAICGDMLERWPYHEQSHQISWLPTFHDLGLIWGLMTPLYGGVPVTFMLPVAFLQRPARWFRAIDHFRGTTTAAPNFGYELCNRKIAQEEIAALDLSCLEAAMNAAEPIRAETLDLLNTRFEQAGLRPEAMSPWYGLAESTLQVSVSGPGDGVPLRLNLSPADLENGQAVESEQSDALILIGCGRIAEMNEVAIVHPETRVRLSESYVGEIWLHGPIVGQGYWERPEATHDTFECKIAGEGDKPWLDTGDLGFMRDGELYVTGRSKDLIIIRGRNLYPQDIEHLAEKIHPAVRPGCAAAFPMRVADEERIGLVVEIDPRKLEGDPDELIKRLRSGIAEGFDVQLHDVACIGPRAIYKTSSGKIQRRRTRDALLADELDVLGRWTGRLRESIPARVSRVLGEDQGELTATQVLESFIWDLLRARPLLELDEQPSVDVPFRELGLSSVTSVEVSGQLADILERSLSPTLLFEYPTTASLAAYLSGSGEIVDVTAFEEALRARRLRDALHKALASSGLPAEELPDEASFLAFLEGRETKTLAKLNLRGPYEDFKRLVPRWLSFFDQSFDIDRVLIYMWRLRGPGFTVFYHERERLITERFGAGEEAIELLLERSEEGRSLDFCELPQLLGIESHYPSGLVYGFKSEGRLSGAVQLLSTRADAFDRSDEELLKRVCMHVVGPALIAGQQMAVSEAKKGAEEELADLAAGIVEGFSFDHFVGDTLDAGLRLFDAERAALYLHDDEGDELYLVASKSADRATPASHTHFPTHEGILGISFKTRERIWIEDAYADPRFEPELDRETGYLTKNIFCAPLLSNEGVVGVIQFLNRSSSKVGPWEHELLDRFIRQILVALHSLPLITDTHVPFLRSLQELEPAGGPVPAVREGLDEAVAIVGIGCRYPGGIVDPESFWGVLRDGVDVIEEIPPNRWRADDFYDPDPDADGKSVTRFGGFIDGIEDFDASFFGISPREARQIDPQHRLVLECAWEAIEHAGIVPRSLMGSSTGVFVGLIYQEYAQRRGVGPWVDGYTLTGNTASVASGRVSYFLGLEGPSLTIDTACSSSLVTLHLACQALTRGECTMALAGGATLMLTPTSFVGFSRMGGLAPDGRCKTFSARADGTSWAEGCGMLVLKRLTDAERDGDRILGVIRGSAVNQDGRSNGLTAPNGSSQRGVIQRAIHQAGVLPTDIDYVECHGTGTSLGDPIEVMALDAVLSEGRQEQEPVRLGSVKTNLGHTQAAAGVAGVIKTVLAMAHEEIPATLHCGELSPHIPWTKLLVAVAAEPTAWPRGERPRRAGVSSFGISGTNVHVILEEAPSGRSRNEEPVDSDPCPLVLSARSLASLQSQAERWSVALADGPAWNEVTRSTAVRRTHFDYRALIGSKDRESGLDALAALSRGAAHPDLCVSSGEEHASLAWLFTGQGSQVAGMGQELYEAFPVFRERLDEVTLYLDAHLSRPLSSVMFAQPGSKASELLRQTAYTQCALFAIELALARLWQSWGIEPDFLLGHSIGELSAACVAGVFSLEDAASLVGARGRLMQGCRDDGAMVSVQCTEAEATSLIESEGLALDIAGLNSPSQTVVSGDCSAIETFGTHFKEAGRKVRELAVSHAFHSVHMDAMLEAFGQVAQGCTFHPPQIPIVSNVTGKIATENQLMSPAYWVRHVRDAVRFCDGMKTLDRMGVDTFLECGPRGVLTAMGTMCLDGGAHLFVPSLRAERSERESILEAMAALYVEGFELDWRGFVGSAAVPHVDLPRYAFQRTRHWIDGVDGGVGLDGHSDPVGGAFWQAVRADAREQISSLIGLPDSLQGQLESVLPHLSAWHREQERDAELGGWIYEERWDFDRGGVARSKPGGHWVLVQPPHPLEVVQQWLGWLEEVGVEVTLVEACVERRAIEERLRGVGDGVTCVVSFAAWDDGDGVLDDPISFGFDSTLAFLQAVPDSGISGPVWLVSQGAVCVESTESIIRPRQSLIWGLGRVFGLEHSARFGGLLDLPEKLDDEALGRACSLLARGGLEDQVALRSRGLFYRRLVRGSHNEMNSPWHARGTVLITGGTGALGAHAARWMVAQGAEHVVLTSRRGLEAEGAEELSRELEGQGAQVTIASCDVADGIQLKALVESLLNAEVPLRSVVHAAGAVGYGWICQLDAAEVRREMRAKVIGAWNLHEAVGSSPLDAMIFYGSIAGLWGSGQQAAYSASNAALEALARYRRAHEQHGLVVHWGPWAGGGMVSDTEKGSESSELRLRKRGLLPMPPERALHALGLALRSGATSLAVVKADWSRLAPVLAFARPRPFFDGVFEARTAMNDVTNEQDQRGDGAAALRAELVAMPASARLHRMRRLLSEATAAVLGATDTSAIDTRTGFTELGFDSLMAVELRKRLETITGLSIPATLAFDHPTIDASAHWLCSALIPESAQSDAVFEEPGNQAAAPGPIAIVGVGLRMPGGATDLESLWEVLSTRVDTLEPIPTERFDLLSLYDPDPDVRGRTYVKHAALLDDVRSFDASFFGISPREAAPMDPQHRLLLEAGWTALEDACIPPGGLRGTDTGVFIGIGPNEYGQHRGRGGEEVDAYDVTGSHMSFAAGRLAYHLGLQGPALSVDTACSSSLVAMQLAAESLRSGKCELALAAGVQVLANPHAMVLLSRTQAVAADGRSKTFSAQADGYGRGEGVGVLVLMRLEDAQSQGRRVLGIIKGAAVNHDGTSSGITAPNGTSQQKVLEAALRDAGVAASDIDVIECHGTGTKLGDPIEVGALAAVYGKRGSRERPLELGTIKTNIGHLESAAGVAGVLKIIASFEHEALPPSLHTTPRNPHIPWASLPVRVTERETPWPTREECPRRAGVSAFGLSGTNAHIILEEPPHQKAPEERIEPELSGLPLLISARGRAALLRQAEQWESWLKEAPQSRWADVVSTAAVGRSHLDSRACIYADDAAATLDVLASLGRGDAHPDLIFEESNPTGRLAFLFTGQGSQCLGMGQSLAQSSSVFRDTLDTVLAELDRHLSKPLRSVIFAEKGSEEEAELDQTRYTQPALFAVEVAWAAFWQHCAVVPDILLGHSIGELVAAHVAGVLSLEDAAKLVCARGDLMQSCESGGAMASLGGSEEEVLSLLASESGRVDIAGLNGPSQTVISGDEPVVEALMAKVEAQGRKATKLSVSHAFHSAHMETMLDDFRTVAESCTFHPPQISVVSNLTGKLATAEELTSPDYWVRHVRQAVRFVDGMRTLHGEGVTTFVECGPKGVLSSMGALCLDQPGLEFVPSHRKGRDEVTTLLRALGQVHAVGHDVDWSQLLPRGSWQQTQIPTYRFEQQPHWLDVALPAQPLDGASGNPLVGPGGEVPGTSVSVFRQRLSTRLNPWLKDHLVVGRVVVPGTALMEMMLSAGASRGSAARLELEDVALLTPLMTSSSGEVDVQITLEGGDGGDRVAVYSTAAGSTPLLHARATLVAGAEPGEGERSSALPPAGATAVDVASLYDALGKQGLGYGPAFCGLKEAWRDDHAIWARVSLGAVEEEEADRFAMHPALLDAAFHAIALRLMEDGGSPELFLPFALGRVRIIERGSSELWARVEVGDISAEVIRADLSLFEMSGELAGRIENLQLKRADASLLRRLGDQQSQSMRYDVTWNSVETPEPLGSGRWAVASRGADEESLSALVRALEGAGLDAARLDSGDDGSWDGVITLWGSGDEPTRQAHESAGYALGDLQGYANRDVARWVWITRGAVCTGPDESGIALGCAGLWGMARSARHEAAELALLLLDVGPSEDFSRVASALGVSDEPELAVREGELLAPRLIRSDEGLVLPDGGSWRIVTAEKGRLDRLRVEVIELEALAPHQARVAVEAAGLNFRDVLNALGMVPIPWLGLELSGVVTEVGAEVTHLEVGARVFGLGEATFASSCVADARYLTPIPEGMGFDEAATIPLVYLTAWYALCDLGHLESGDAILVHAAAGGVGMAAVQLAQHLGAEVYGTASEPKWETLRALGLDDAHIASSRDLGFQQKFSTHRDGKPIDVVLNALAREFVDASLELLGSGGRFLEMGKTDIRSAQWLAENKPEIAYHAFDLLDVDPERMQAMLLEITSLLGRGEMKLLPHQSFPMARLSHVFRFMAQAKHIGKLVVVPTASERLARDEGTVLITGAFGPLGRAVAQWLVREHQVRHLLLASRRGLDTPGAQAWVAELERDGAEVTVAACDVAVLESVRALMGLVGAHTPLSGVVHTAGVLEDGVVTSQDTERLTRVLRPKVDGAWNLHLVTEGSDLDFFVLYSSLAGLMGNVGQSNYAAANTFMDALAQSRWREGQPALSMLWGPWADGGMAASLSDADTARMRRQGIELLSEERGMDLLGRAMKADSPISVAAAFDPTTYQRALSEDGRAVAPLFRELVSRGQGPRVEGQSLRERLDALPTAAREHALLDWVCDEVARVLGLSSGGAVSPTLSLKDMGVDSLMAVELRNRLMALSGEQLSATLVFDYPHVQAIAELLAERVGLAGEEADEAPGVSDDAIRDLLGRISIEELRASGMLSDLMALAEGEANGPAEVESTEEGDVEFDALDDDELLRQAMQMIED